MLNDGRRRRHVPQPDVDDGKGSPRRRGWDAGRFVHFNFGYLLESTYADCKDAAFFINLLGRLKEISRHSHDECRVAGHKTIIGTEVLPIGQFCDALQAVGVQFEDSISKLTVYRAAGDNRAMVGVVVKGIFIVFGIETKINTLYRHGRRK